jgi:hypothetical protein
MQKTNFRIAKSKSRQPAWATLMLPVVATLLPKMLPLFPLHISFAVAT